MTDQYEDLSEEQDIEVYYAAFEHDEAHNGCAGCLLLPLITLVFAIILLIFLAV